MVIICSNGRYCIFKSGHNVCAENDAASHGQPGISCLRPAVCVLRPLFSHNKVRVWSFWEESFLNERIFPHFIIINRKVILAAKLWRFDIRVNQNLIFNLLLTLRKLRPIFIQLFYLCSNYEFGWDKPSSQKCHINLNMHCVISPMNILKNYFTFNTVLDQKTTLNLV